MFSDKNWSLGGLKVLMKNNWQHRYRFNVLGSGRPHIVHTVRVLSIFFSISAFSASRLRFLLGNSLSNSHL